MAAEVIEQGYETKIVQPKRTLFRLQIPYNLRFPLAWTVFFAALGIIIQSIRVGSFVFGNFFWGNYIDWFKSFGNFTDPAYYSDEMSVILSILHDWYYFFYTGGLISVIWAFVSWLINVEFVFKKKAPEPQPETQKVVQSVIVEKPIYIETKPSSTSPSPVKPEVIESWLLKGYELLAEQRIDDAQLIYNEIKREYAPEKDPSGMLYVRITQLYNEILDKKKNFGKKQEETWEG